MVFYTGNAERMRLNTTGALVLSGGTTTANGIGITFPASQSASTNANTLDDYEEGTWTPSIGGTATYNAGQYAYYIKIGRSVTLLCNVIIDVIGTGSLQTLSGVPFAAITGARSPLTIAVFDNITTSVFSLGAWVNSNATTIQFSGMLATGFSASYTLNVFGSATRIDMNGSYITN